MKSLRSPSPERSEALVDLAEDIQHVVCNGCCNGYDAHSKEERGFFQDSLESSFNSPSNFYDHRVSPLASSVQSYLATDISDRMIEIAVEKHAADPVPSLTFSIGAVDDIKADAAFVTVLDFPQIAPHERMSPTRRLGSHGSERV